MAYGEGAGTAAGQLVGGKQDTAMSILRDFDPQLQRLMKVVGHLMVIGDRLEGSRPQEAANPSVDHPPHCLVDDIRRKRDVLQLLCSQLEEATQRVDLVLGIGADQPAATMGRIA